MSWLVLYWKKSSGNSYNKNVIKWNHIVEEEPRKEEHSKKRFTELM